MPVRVLAPKLPPNSEYAGLQAKDYNLFLFLTSFSAPSYCGSGLVSVSVTVYPGF
jgi:hypothetical protein